MSFAQELHEARKERLARMMAKVRAEQPALKANYDSVPADVLEAIETVGEWVERQRMRFEGIPIASNGPPISAIQKAVAEHYGISIHDLIGGRRAPKVSFPRMVAFHISRRLTTRSYPEIGRRFGGKDHTTILYGDRKITKMLETDASLQASVEMLIKQLGGERK